jgi:hypothetical protein
MSLTERAGAGLVTRCRAGRCDWYLARHAARYIRDARRYRAGAQSPRLQTLLRGLTAGSHKPAVRNRRSGLCLITAESPDPGQ